MTVMLVIIIIVFGPASIVLAAKRFMQSQTERDFERWEREIDDAPILVRAWAFLDAVGSTHRGGRR